MTRNWLLWGILGYLAWTNRSMFTLGRQETILYWIDPETEQILYLPGVNPPASGWRPASEAELQAWAALPM